MVLPPSKHRRSSASLKATKPPQNTVDLLETCRLVNSILTEDLCDEVFATTRIDERQRTWSLHVLATFWTGVILESPPSLTQAVEQAVRSGLVEGSRGAPTPQGFFDRAKTLKWTFFAELFDRFVEAITPQAPPTFSAEFAFLRKHFPEIWVIDGSRLDAVRHRLKILWNASTYV